MDPALHSIRGFSASTVCKKKRIKNVQKLELVRLMKANFLFIRGKHAIPRSEKSRADVWKVIAGRLNSLGPPVQSAEAWQRRWNDMRSATKSKMAKIQNYVREHGEDCPYELNLVERLIWETFSVKPDEYMRELNMKMWREKQQKCAGPTVGDSVSSCSSQLSVEQSFDMGWNQVETTVHDTGATGWSSSSFAFNDSEGGVMENTNRTSQPDQSFGPPAQTMEMNYAGYSGVSTSSNLIPSGSTDLVPGSNMLRELNKLFDLVLKQNEEILALLRQPAGNERW
ncbi:AGAP001331-PA [Anopheles gambiae str. PEST]|uniref:Regulatory protein zeste n=1 Tax=Anopheles gambiae TaxID=7165 RepID=A7UVP2_ANOGA|nr:AGAP001331-PA [Anopheles gambiae str. PEST]